ncbi:type II toxin-antitoxin system mRNA interferase toxin, RelE/StbE family [archaeon]|jgi:addiction module RelE/StbE family toxin|nr:type II toxin-antitoxin system mRNA interferase toxin, RelE/StbE family [Candidatus Woesearchaeota archaeon]MBT4135880.1 type II toxin-antitoxin system mRNA interferase toxin, RelE/StbE family [archaeon]MBT4242240.1 type II toxin-antitoxin system mRNA interferase toxin, RelE/StbE family [archaeon]MBT4417928.1 type II toxin-antitoxin system mRNA interferase toxin, RelE/StbE family [archaeon]
MYKITTRTKRAEKQFHQFINEKIAERLELLKQNPRGKLGAHKLKGKLKDKWSCWFGADVRMIYEIDDKNKEIIIIAVGSHKLYL